MQDSEEGKQKKKTGFTQFPAQLRMAEVSTPESERMSGEVMSGHKVIV